MSDTYRKYISMLMMMGHCDENEIKNYISHFSQPKFAHVWLSQRDLVAFN